MNERRRGRLGWLPSFHPCGRWKRTRKREEETCCRREEVSGSFRQVRLHLGGQVQDRIKVQDLVGISEAAVKRAGAKCGQIRFVETTTFVDDVRHDKHTETSPRALWVT